MKHAILVLVTCCMFSASASAQAIDSTPHALPPLAWESQPSSEDFTSHYPAAAISEYSPTAHVVFDCLVLATGRLHCTLLTESSSGFGVAAGPLIPMYRAPRIAGGEVTAGGRTLVMMVFSPPPRAGPPPPLPVAVAPPVPQWSTWSVIERPVWTAQPSADQIATAYPRTATARRESTDVSVTCYAGLYGLLHCYGATAPPEVVGMGFEAAAMSLMHIYRIAGVDADGHTTPGHSIYVNVRFDPPH